MNTPWINSDGLTQIQSKKTNEISHDVSLFQENTDDTEHHKSYRKSIKFDLEKGKRIMESSSLPDRSELELKRKKIKYLLSILKTIQKQSDNRLAKAVKNKNHPIVETVKTERRVKTKTSKDPQPKMREDKKEHHTAPISNKECKKDTVGTIYSKTVISPFITIIEIDKFLRLPISGNIIQQSANFLDSKNRTQQSESHSQFIHTELSNSEPLQFKLTSSIINEMISISSKKEMHPTKHRVYKASVNPIHMHSKKKNTLPKCKNNVIEVMIPVVVGEYEINISMSNPVFFEHELIGLKEVSNKVVLGNCNFIPSQFEKPLSDGTCPVSKAKIALKGDIIQKFTYSAKPNHDKNASQQMQRNNQITQKMDITLIVLLSQIQKMKTLL